MSPVSGLPPSRERRRRSPTCHFHSHTQPRTTLQTHSKRPTSHAQIPHHQSPITNPPIPSPPPSHSVASSRTYVWKGSPTASHSPVRCTPTHIRSEYKRVRMNTFPHLAQPPVFGYNRARSDRRRGRGQQQGRGGCGDSWRGGVGRRLRVELGRRRVRRRLPGAGRVGRASRLRERARRLGALAALLHEPGPERAGPAPGLPGQQRRLADRPAHAQRGRRQHHPLERPLPAIPPFGLPRQDPRRRGRRLPHDLLGPGTLFRRQRPAQRRRRHDRRPWIPRQVPTGRRRPCLSAKQERP